MSHYGYLVFRPRAPLGFFDSGVEGYAGTSMFLEAHRQNSANFSAASQAGSGERFGELTLALVLQFFVPLFVFAVAGVSVTREREAGTLALLLCQGASWGAVLWGKLVGVLLAVALVVAPGLLLASGWLAADAGAAFGADTLARAAGLGLLHLVFLTACAALAVAVSAWQATSRGALVVLVGLWIGLWVALPRVLPAIGTALYPVPARSAFDAEVEARVQELGDSHNPNDPVFTRLRDETLARYGVSRVEDLPLNFGGLVMQHGERLTSEAFAEHRARLLDVYRRQARLVEAAGLLSPYLAVRLASMALAGSDVAHLVEFERQAERFRYTLIQALNDRHVREVDQAQDRYGEVFNGAPTRQRIARALFDELPAFAYDPPRLGWALAQQPVALVAGALGSVLLVALLAWTAARRPRLG